MRILVIALTTLLVGTAAQASELITKTSPHSVADTADRLVAAVENAGATLFGRVDHAAGAASIDAELAPNELVIFGNPRLGTGFMQQNPSAGLDLPLRVVIYTGADGETVLAYHAPERLVADHGIPADFPGLEAMTGALENLTNAAIAE